MVNLKMVYWLILLVGFGKIDFDNMQISRL